MPDTLTNDMNQHVGQSGRRYDHVAISDFANAHLGDYTGRVYHIAGASAQLMHSNHNVIL